MLAAALGDGLFRQLTTLEHQVAACIVAGDSYAQAARYVGVSPSTVRRSVLRIVARLSDRAGAPLPIPLPIPLKVLVADDHPAHRLMLTAVFESLGCSVRTVENGAQAVALAAGFDVICLDRNMPGMTGDEAALRIGRSAFLIACTSEPERASDHFDVVVAKPLLSEALEMAIRSARWVIARRRQGVRS
ncbi:MAG TPA: response regulator [Caulobacteraceae bacterium]